MPGLQHSTTSGRFGGGLELFLRFRFAARRSNGFISIPASFPLFIAAAAPIKASSLRFSVSGVTAKRIIFLSAGSTSGCVTVPRAGWDRRMLQRAALVLNARHSDFYFAFGAVRASTRGSTISFTAAARVHRLLRSRGAVGLHRGGRFTASRDAEAGFAEIDNAVVIRACFLDADWVGVLDATLSARLLDAHVFFTTPTSSSRLHAAVGLSRAFRVVFIGEGDALLGQQRSQHAFTFLHSFLYRFFGFFFCFFHLFLYSLKLRLGVLAALDNRGDLFLQLLEAARQHGLHRFHVGFAALIDFSAQRFVVLLN
mmetsp:Transcript_951/g.1989  ORF Transcript_951/g.1989 Transcript_951/m.1989 type:complete len:312 (+) Transcript_951:603-1538(+)